MLEILIENGWVVDGTGNPRFMADVGISDGEIAYVGKGRKPDADRRIDAQGKVVTPGFWDVHTHSEFTMLMTSELPGYSFQGITSIVTGNCGYSVFPDRGHREQQFTESQKQQLRDFQWSTLEEYAALVNQQGSTVNAVPLIGAGTTRWMVMKNDDRAPREGEMQAMKQVVLEGMEQGAVGMSCGLDYIPGRFAQTEELVELARVLQEYDGLFVSHTRDVSPVYAYSYHSREVLCPTEDRAKHLEGVREAIEVGRQAGIPVHVSHLHTSGIVGTEMGMIHEARNRGVDLTVDAMAYNVPWCPRSDVLLVQTKNHSTEYADATLEEFCEALRSPEVRRELSQSSRHRRFFSKDTAGKWRLVRTGREDLEGKSVAQIARATGRTPVDTMFDVVLDRENPCLIIPPEEVIQDLPEQQILDDLIMMGSDAIGFNPEEPYARATARGWASVPRFLQYAEKYNYPLEQAVRRLTSFPASRFGFSDRGLISSGKVADVLVFDPEAVQAGSTLEEPYRLSEGMDQVIVGGVLVIDDGEMTDQRPGEVLLR